MSSVLEFHYFLVIDIKLKAIQISAATTLYAPLLPCIIVPQNGMPGYPDWLHGHCFSPTNIEVKNQAYIHSSKKSGIILCCFICKTINGVRGGYDENWQCW
jgi:hypothetical protein